MPATLGDVIKVYVKPSLDGAMVIRKTNSIQTSARLKAAQDKMAATQGKDSAPSRVAHKACSKDGNTVKKRLYIAGKGYQEVEVCPIGKMKSYLKSATASVMR